MIVGCVRPALCKTFSAAKVLYYKLQKRVSGLEFARRPFRLNLNVEEDATDIIRPISESSASESAAITT